MCNTKLEEGGGGPCSHHTVVLLELVLVSYSSTHSFGAFSPLHGTGDHHYLLLVPLFGFASSLSNVNQQWGVRELIREHWELIRELREIALVGWLRSRTSLDRPQAFYQLTEWLLTLLGSPCVRKTRLGRPQHFNTDGMASTLDNKQVHIIILLVPGDISPSRYVGLVMKVNLK